MCSPPHPSPRISTVRVKPIDQQNIIPGAIPTIIQSDQGDRMHAKNQLRKDKCSKDDIEPIKIELTELETKLKNWIDVLGSGIKSFIKHQRSEAKERSSGIR